MQGRRGTAGVGTLRRLIVRPSFPSQPFHQLFPLPRVQPSRQFSSSSQNPVTPRRAHPETDDKVHPATPPFPFDPPPTHPPVLLTFLREHVRVPTYVYIYIYIYILHAHLRGEKSCTHVDIYIRKTTDEGLCRRPSKKKERESGRVSKKSRRSLLTRSIGCPNRFFSSLFFFFTKNLEF